MAHCANNTNYSHPRELIAISVITMQLINNSLQQPICV